MEIVYTDEELERYMQTAVKASPDKPVLVDKFLEAAIEVCAHGFPHGKAVRLDHHGTLDGGVVGEPGLTDHVQVPLAVVVATRCDCILSHWLCLPGLDGSAN